MQRARPSIGRTEGSHGERVAHLPIERSLDGHHAPVPFFLTRDMFGGLPVEVAGGEISGLVGCPVASPHTHSVPEVYLLLSPQAGGAVIDVLMEGQQFELVAPGAFYVPAGRQHHFVTRRAVAGSYCLGVLLGPFSSPGAATIDPRRDDE